MVVTTLRMLWTIFISRRSRSVRRPLSVRRIERAEDALVLSALSMKAMSTMSSMIELATMKKSKRFIAFLK